MAVMRTVQSQDPQLAVEVGLLDTMTDDDIVHIVYMSCHVMCTHCTDNWRLPFRYDKCFIQQ